MATLSRSDVIGTVLKDFYTGPIRDQLNSETILLKRLQRNEEIVDGAYVVMPLHTGRNVGVMARRESGTLPTAGKQQYKDMRFPVRYNYGRIRLTGPVIASSRTNRGTFARILDQEVRGMVRDFKNDLNRQLFCDGSGRIGCVRATAAGAVYTISDPWDYGNQATSLKWVQPGDRLAFESTSAGSTYFSPQNAGATFLPATSVNIKAKTVTFGGTVNGSVAVGQHLIRGNDDAASLSVANSNLRAATTYDDGVEMMGLVGLCSGDGTSTGSFPRNAAEATWTAMSAGKVYSYWNGAATIQELDVQKTNDSLWQGNVLGNAGVSRALTTDLMQQALDTGEQLGQAQASIIITTYGVRRRYLDLCLAERRFVNTMELDGGFKAIDFNGIPMVPEKDCPEGMMFFLPEENIGIARMSDFYWLDKDGAVLSRGSNVDEWEATMALYAETFTDRRNALVAVTDVQI